VAALLGLTFVGPIIAGEARKAIQGNTLTIVRDDSEVTVEQGDRVVVRYRYAGKTNRPHVSTATSPGGNSALAELAFDWRVDGADFSGETGQSGRQVHEAWEALRIDATGGTEKAILQERLLWESADGDYLLEEHRTLTVPVPSPGQPQMLVWQATFTAADDAIDTLTLDGGPHDGLIARLTGRADDDGYFNAAGGAGVAQTNGGRAAWTACTIHPSRDRPMTVALFDAPANPRHPTTWRTGAPATDTVVAATLGLTTEPLSLVLGKTVSVRFGLALFDESADAEHVAAAYLDWYRLEASARSGMAAGLIAQYFAGTERSPACTRVDSEIALDWSGGMPDDRLPPGPFSVQWQGQVRVQRDGHYRFSLDGSGKGRVWVDEQLVHSSNDDGTARWPVSRPSHRGRPKVSTASRRPPVVVTAGSETLAEPSETPFDERSSDTIELDLGYHAIRVEYSGDEGAAVRLVWDSDHFTPEVINACRLVHDAANEGPVAMELLYDAGRAVFDRYGCARCHTTPGVLNDRRPGPPLSLTAEIKPGYLNRWLADPQALRPGTPMPEISMTAKDTKQTVAAIAAYLRTVDDDKSQGATPHWPELTKARRVRFFPGEPQQPFDRAGMMRGAGRWGVPPQPPVSLPPIPSDVDVLSGADRDKQVARGRERFVELGCGACHAPEAPNDIDPSLAPSLADVGAKWPEARLRQFVTSPTDLHPEGGMPDFAIRPIDAARLAGYLSTFGGADKSTPAPTSKKKADAPDAQLVARGKQLVEQHGCAACHDLPGVKLPVDFAAPLDPDSSLASGCLAVNGTTSGERSPPHFNLPLADRVALVEFLVRRPMNPTIVAASERTARIVRDTLQCFRCHVRNGTGGEGMSRAVRRRLEEEATLDQVALTPPEISGVGARLRHDWLLKTLAGDPPSPRPWMKVRMPRFAISQEQREAIADYLASADAIPGLKAARPHGLPAALEPTAGALLSPSGFSCINCHYIGSIPSPSETSAPDLTMITHRVGRDWFHRWVSNPARIIPSTPMPAFNIPATEIAGEDLLVQKEAVWQFLKHADNRSIRKTLAEGTTAVEVAGLRPAVVQGRVEGFAPVVRGIALGFKNGNSVLFDFERVAWRGHWKGGFLNEAGRHGAQHWWETVGEPIWATHDGAPPVLYRDRATGDWIGSALWRQRFGFVDRVTLVGRAVRIEYRLRVPGERTGTHEPESWVRVVELVEPNPAGDAADGLTRSLEISGVPDGYDVIVQRSLGGFDGQVTLGDTPWDDLPQNDDGPTIAEKPTLVAKAATGRRWVTRLAGDTSARWTHPPESITYPVEQPFSDDLPMDPKKRFDSFVVPGAGRLAVTAANPGPRHPVKLVWQTAEVADGTTLEEGPPRLWPNPAEHSVLQDPEKPHYVSYPEEVERLGQSLPLRVPPGFKVERLPLEEEFLVCSLDFYRGKLLLGGYDGQLRIADDTNDDGLEDSYRYFGGTLQQVTNLRVYDGQIYVTSPGALYRIHDTNGDEVADSYELLSSLWDCSAHQNDFFFGLVRDRAGNIYGANSTPFIYRPDGKPPGYYLRGDVLKITPDGRTLKVGTGTRFQFGWAEDRQGRLYFNINQGHYNYTNGIHLVKEGAHYGFLEPDLSKVQAPVVRAPYPWCKSLNGMDIAESRVPFGPFHGQGFSADYNTNQVIRWTDYDLGTASQGACYPFFTGTDAGPTEIRFGPDGSLYVAFMCDQGWYGGRARSGIYKVSYVGPPPFAIWEARPTADGFVIEMTGQVDPASVTLDVCPKVHRWWHENKGDYASPEIAHEDVAVRKLTLGYDGKTLILVTDPHVTPRLYRLELKGLRAADGRELADGLVFLTVHWLPGQVTEPKSDW